MWTKTFRLIYLSCESFYFGRKIQKKTKNEKLEYHNILLLWDLKYFECMIVWIKEILCF